MKLKVLLSSMFVLTAVINSSEVDTCGFKGFRFEGIKVHYTVKDSDFNIISLDDELCGQSMTEVTSTIKEMLRAAQRRIDELTMQRIERDQFNVEAHMLVGQEITGD